jgi:gentisate 1,2-dioxygenase
MQIAATETNDTPYTQRAQYHDPENAFLFKWTPVPRRQFLAERDRAMNPATGMAEIPLDSSDALVLDYPATTPMILCRYLRLADDAPLDTQYKASGEIYYVMSGAGESVNGDDRIAWGEGDLFCFPGGGVTHHAAAGGEALLFSITNEPQLAFERLEPPMPGQAVLQTVHFPAEEIARRFEAVYARPKTGKESGRALLFSTAAVGESTNLLPSINVAINTLEPGGDQRPHRHNGVAVTLALQGEAVHSMIEDERVDWSLGAAQITPPAELHAHHNRGNDRMVSLVVQDEGLHYYTRTPGFSWD